MIETFFKQFELLTDAPNAVPKLRELILQLAVQGKLVEQDPNDEPVSKLIERIRKKKDLLIKQKKVKKSSLLPIEADEIPYEVPQGWKWVRVDDISNVGTGSTPLTSDYKYYVDGNIPWITSAATSQDFISRAETYITATALSDYRLKMYPIGTLVIALYGQGKTRGQISELKIETTVNQACATVTLIETTEELRAYIKHVFKKKYEELRALAAGGAQPNLNVGKIKEILIPLPPCEEQKRIVAKVDRLMKLCDELEERQRKWRSHTIRLNEGAIAQLLTTSTPDDFTHHWQRIYNHFDLLYSLPENITKLRQAILQLAVQGKLVPQYPNDEPAQILLKNLRITKQLKNEKKGRKLDLLPPIDLENSPFGIPTNWQWARFQDVATIASNLVKPESYLDFPHVAPDNIEKQSGRLLSYRTVREDEVRSSNHRFFSGQILYSKIRPNLAKVVIVSFDGLCSADMYPINAHIDASFLLKYMLSSTFLSMSVKSDTRVAMPKINQDELNKILVPVPPLAEQKRIVAEVDRLMALCDRLEADLRQAQIGSDRLMETALQQLLAV
ncbi:MAG: restriction endonuclease subunit S [Leptolyngbyaceae cyanobacterium SM1_3_5]|nr:restriction endonuclease subunit S [Leptolyngbyaceae cyanobacterium SM1_3_5]